MNVNIPISIGGLVRTTADSARTAPSASSAPKKAETRPTESLLPTDLVSVESAQIQPQQQSPAEKTAADQAEEARQHSEKINEYLSQANTQLKFTVSEETGRIIIRVIDTASDQVVRTIPPDTVVRLSEQASQLRGLLFNTAG